MRKHLSILMLLARSSVYKIITLLAVMTAVEAILFYRAISLSDTMLEVVVDRSYISFVFAAACVLMTIILWLPGCEFGSKTGYTIKRLSVSVKSFYILQVLHNIMCYLLLWLLQVVIMYVFSNWWLSAVNPDYINSQSIVLAWYRSPLLHRLMPLASISGWLRNILLVSALGFIDALVPFQQRSGVKPYSAILMIILAVIMFQRELNSWIADIPLMAVSTAAIVYAFYDAFKVTVYED